MYYWQRKQYRAFIRWLDKGYPGIWAQFEFTRSVLRNLNYPPRTWFCGATILMQCHYPGFGSNFTFLRPDYPEFDLPWVPLVKSLPLSGVSVSQSIRLRSRVRQHRHPDRTRFGYRARLFSKIVTLERHLAALPLGCCSGPETNLETSGPCSSGMSSSTTTAAATSG